MDDLISRTALLKSLNEQAPKPTTDDLYTVNMCIINAPAVDAAPVVHGRWVYEHGDPVLMPCSVCGYQVYRYNNTHYCPECGAKMDRQPGRGAQAHAETPKAAQ